MKQFYEIILIFVVIFHNARVINEFPQRTNSFYINILEYFFKIIIVKSLLIQRRKLPQYIIRRVKSCIYVLINSSPKS